MKIDLIELTFIKTIDAILIELPITTVHKKINKIIGMEKYYELNYEKLSLKYKNILMESDSEKLRCIVNSLPYEEKVDFCALFVLRSLSNSKPKPSLKNICQRLGFTRYTTQYLSNNLLNTKIVESDDLDFKHQIDCPNCNNYISTTTHYIGGDNFKKNLIECPNCKHRFFFKVSRQYKEDATDRQLYCTCNTCKTLRKKLFDYIEYNIEVYESELFNYIFNKHATDSTISLTQKYKIHKNSLSKTEDQILDLKPENFSELEVLLDEIIRPFAKNNTECDTFINKSIAMLEKHGVIYPVINEDLLKKEIHKFTNNFRELVLLYKNVNLTGLSRSTNGDLNYITIDNSYCSITYDKLNISNISDYELNPNYFVTDKAKLIYTKKYNIFNSKAEYILYNTLKRDYPNCIICLNVTLSTIININDLRDVFSKNEINYLKHCTIDFIICDNQGCVIEFISLRKGKHHDDDEFINKASIKRKCIEFLGIPYSEEY